jgi:high-affinity Fe2+/Pb2+ permease
MIEESIGFPVGFYVGLMLLALAFAYAWSKREAGLGIPMAAVLATVSVWYFGDALYNDYDSYIREIGLRWTPKIGPVVKR